MWAPAQDTFYAFAGRNDQLGTAEFAKLCVDARLIGRGMTKPDCDVMFTRYSLKKRLHWEGFQSCLRTIATKRNEVLSSVVAKVGECEGPARNATQADNVRFHDDQDTYTGAHLARFGIDL